MIFRDPPDYACLLRSNHFLDLLNNWTRQPGLGWNEVCIIPIKRRPSKLSSFQSELLRKNTTLKWSASYWLEPETGELFVLKSWGDSNFSAWLLSHRHPSSHVPGENQWPLPFTLYKLVPGFTCAKDAVFTKSGFNNMPSLMGAFGIYWITLTLSSCVKCFQFESFIVSTSQQIIADNYFSN